MLELLIAIFVLLLVLLLVLLFGEWYSHVSTIKIFMEEYKYGYGNYRKFKREVLKRSLDDLEFSSV
jgi:hypothetical protein